MKKNPAPKAFPFHHTVGILLLLLIAISLSACGSNATDISSYTPDPTEIDLVKWEEEYPVQYEQWAASVHGEAYLSGDENAPTCNDCHEGPVEGEDIRTTEFRLSSPDRCARCHNDDDLMAEYEIADDVYETYIADFHGATIRYYAQTDLTAIRDEAVCSDCHGSHAIYPKENELSSVSEVNLQSTCAGCHTDANEAFTSAYGHYRAIQSPASSSSDSTIVFLVKLAYQALIPLTLGGMLAYIGLDILFRAKRKKAANQIEIKQEETTAETNESADSNENEVQS